MRKASPSMLRLSKTELENRIDELRDAMDNDNWEHEPNSRDRARICFALKSYENFYKARYGHDYGGQDE